MLKYLICVFIIFVGHALLGQPDSNNFNFQLNYFEKIIELNDEKIKEIQKNIDSINYINTKNSNELIKLNEKIEQKSNRDVRVVVAGAFLSVFSLILSTMAFFLRWKRGKAVLNNGNMKRKR